MKIIKNLFNGFIKVFGDIKIFPWPLFMVYDPGSYRIRGHEVRKVINIIQPGDILLRGYNNYLDGYFIPGYFSHAGLYVGEITPDDEKKLTVPEGKKLFKTGEQMVIHAMAEGVFVQDILDFCRCDKMMILRFPEEFALTNKIPGNVIQDYDFSNEEKDIVNKINNGEKVLFRDAFKTVFNIALQQIGKKYDFSFDFINYNNLSCTEVGDDFLRANLDPVWQSNSVSQKKLNKITS